MREMADVIAQHLLLEHERSGAYACAAFGCNWEFRRGTVNYFVKDTDVVSRKFAAHLSTVLGEAGFGPVKEAAAVTLEDAAADYHQLVLHPDASTRGFLHYLRKRAAALRGS